MPTWSEIREEIKTEYDLVEETFVDDSELLEYANEALQDLESEIHSIHDKYFHTEATLSLVTGTSAYSLPTDIFATKITGMYYNDGGSKYEIKPMKDLSEIMYITSDMNYQYRLINSTASGMQIKLYPTSRETNSTNVTLYYRRNVKLFTLDADELDILEGKNFIKQYILDRVANKERMTLDAPESPQLARKRKLFLDAIENMIDDDNTEVGVDMCFYEESV